jgi:peptidoglycan lytic transglycosylase F
VRILPASAEIRQNVPMRKSMHSLFIPIACLSTALLTSCTPTEPARKPWREELSIIVPQAGSGVNAEFELQLVTLFAQSLQIKTRLLPLPPGQIMPTLLANKAHIAAAGLRSNEGDGINFGPVYQTVAEVAVCNGKTPWRLTQLASRSIAVAAGSAQDAALHEARKKLAVLSWDTRPKQTAPDLLAEVADGKLECTIANEEQLATARNFHPDLKAALEIAPPSRLAWALAPDSDAELSAKVRQFFERIKQDGTLNRLLDRFYGHNDRLDPLDAVTFVTKVRTDLPNYRGMFEEAEALTGIEWQLLAALAYQESHWNPLATSPTNVRGMMMLTEETADRMKVKNRLDAHESIIAGARYLQLLADELPHRIPARDRTWMAMAAYNQGLGHLEDARVLAARARLNPDMWLNVRKTMPLLSDTTYAEQTKHGQARGGEAVVLVERVRLYYDMLKRMNPRNIQRPSSSPYYLSPSPNRPSCPPGQLSRLDCR